MAENLDSKVRAKVWLTPDQIDDLRSACYSTGADYLQQRNEAIIALMHDTGLRVGELVAVDVDMLREGNSVLYVPTEIQKDYPNDNEPSPATLELSSGVTRLLSSYLNSRWKDSPALFPSRSSDRITTQGVRNAISKVAVEAGVDPYLVDGTRGEPDDVTPHALRHSVAYRMMNAEEGNTLYDVRNRLRHRSIQTTEQVYDHIIRVWLTRTMSTRRITSNWSLPTFRDNDWHYVPDEHALAISLGSGGEGEEGQDCGTQVYARRTEPKKSREGICSTDAPCASRTLYGT